MATVADGFATLGPVFVALLAGFQVFYTHLHSLHDLYAALAAEPLMKIT